MKDLVIVGTGDYALVAFQFLKESDQYKVVAFSEERDFIRMQQIEGLPNFAYEDLEKKAPVNQTLLLIAIGPNKVNTVRERLYLDAKSKGYSFLTYISPKATVWDENSIGENSVIFPNCVVEPYARVGNNCVLWSGAILAHHSIVEDHCFLAPGVCISGRSTIGANSFIGINSTVRDNVKIGEKCIVGGGALIKKDLDNGGVYSAKGTDRYNDDSFNTKV